MSDDDPSSNGHGRKRPLEQESTANKPSHHGRKSASASDKIPAKHSDLSSLLCQSGDKEATHYGELVNACNDLSTTIHQSVNKMDTAHPQQANFLRSWLATGVARVLQNRMNDPLPSTVTTVAPAPPPTGNKKDNPPAQMTTYATAAASANSSEPAQKKQVMKASPPRDQGKSDRRIMVRLPENHPARLTDLYALRLKIRAATKHADIVQDVWSVPSGFTILTPSPAKAAQLLEDAESIRVALAATSVERQESWSTFVVGPVAKTQYKLFGSTKVSMEDIRSELATVEDRMPITNVSWTKKSETTQLHEGFIRVCVRSYEAHKFPASLRLFGRPVSVQMIKKKPIVASCTRCFGFHHERNCARVQRCFKCGDHAHDEQCTKPARCLNCRGPHSSTYNDCPAKPRVVNGQIMRVKKEQLKPIRSAQGRAYAALHPTEQAHIGAEKPESDQHQSHMAMETDGEPSGEQNTDQATQKKAQTDHPNKPAQPPTAATENPFSALQETEQQQNERS